jgi:hypothetical protein
MNIQQAYEALANRETVTLYRGIRWPQGATFSKDASNADKRKSLSLLAAAEAIRLFSPQLLTDNGNGGRAYGKGIYCDELQYGATIFACPPPYSINRAREALSADVFTCHSLWEDPGLPCGALFRLKFPKGSLLDLSAANKNEPAHTILTDYLLVPLKAENFRKYAKIVTGLKLNRGDESNTWTN